MGQTSLFSREAEPSAASSHRADHLLRVGSGAVPDLGVFGRVPSEITNNPTDSLIIEDRRDTTWADEQRHPIPDGECIGVIHLQPVSVLHGDSERAKGRAVLEHADRLVKGVAVHVRTLGW
jgi:hypothetical protein